MSREITDTISSAVNNTTTSPVYLIEFGFVTTTRVASWDVDISWNGQTWQDSGIEVTNISAESARIRFPNGDDDPWLALMLNEGVRGRTVKIYEHHTDETASPQTSAIMLFDGIMDVMNIGEDVKVTCIESSQAKGFPPNSIDQPTFTHLLASGSRIEWGNDVLVVP